jgi:hypothetical protein
MTEIEAYTKLAQDLEQFANFEAVMCQGMVDGGIMVLSLVIAIVVSMFVGFGLGRTGD